MDIRNIGSIFIRIVIVVAIVLLLYASYVTINGIYVNSRKGAARDAASNYAKVIEYDILLKEMGGLNPRKDGIFILTNLPNKGTKPSRVAIILENGKVERGDMVFGDYVVEFKNGEIFSIEKD